MHCTVEVQLITDEEAMLDLAYKAFMLACCIILLNAPKLITNLCGK